LEQEPEHEWKLRAAAIPIAFALALAFHTWATGHFLQRTFLTMPLHELGHAVTGWVCGFAAIPGLWKTIIPESRTLLVTAVLVVALAYGAYRAWTGQRMMMFGAVAVAALLVFLGVTADVDDAQAAITFGGDAGAIVIGTALVLTMFAPPASRLRTNQLRWGFLAIGAAAYVDTFATWWSARRDTDAIPFGEIEGVGLSDPSKLQDIFSWSTRQLVDRYVLVGTTCAIVILAVWAFATWRARAAAA